MRIYLLCIPLLCIIIFAGCSPEQVADITIDVTSSNDFNNDHTDPLYPDNPIDKLIGKDKTIDVTPSNDFNNDYTDLLYPGNPIDKAFEQDYEVASATVEINYLASRYLEAWENEWNNITKTYLSNLKFDQDRESFEDFINSFNEYATTASNIEWLNYTDISVEPSERVFGTAARGTSLFRMADLYKDQVFYLIECFVDDYTFIYSGNGAEIEKIRDVRE